MTSAAADDVDVLAAKDQITELLVHYTYLVDSQQRERIADEIFAEDAVGEYSPDFVFRGRAAAVEFFQRSRPKLEATAHVLSNFHIEVDGDRATARTYATAWHWIPETAALGPQRPADWVHLIVYNDALVKTPEGWRITHRWLNVLGPSGVGIGSLPASFSTTAPTAGGMR
jgi:hypothetical protein